MLSADVLSVIMLGVVVPNSQHNNKMYDSHSNMALSMQVSRFYCYAVCLYAEFRHALCRGAFFNKKFT